MQGLPVGQDFLCKCADRECNEMLSLNLGEYELVRSVPAVAPGHELTEGERVVTQAAGRYIVVEKTEKAAEVARLLDPRR
jgi:hypothetical protein